MSSFTPEQEAQIKLLRKLGIGYRKIATELDLNRDAVRYFCKQNELAGKAKPPEERIRGVECIQCGARLPPSTSGRTRIFCSSKCRYRWWRETGDQIDRPMGKREEKLCAYCGKPIIAYKNKQRKYCNHECYIRDRFWRLEDGREPYVSPKDR